MSRTRKANDKYHSSDAHDHRRGHKHQVFAKGVRREDPDLARMGKALIEFALAEAEAAAEAEDHEHRVAESEEDEQPFVV